MMKRRKTSHRHVWKTHNGSIPKDNDGRSFEIHHIDGDPDNNDITNLIALTIHEHYEIHYWQEDWGACAAIGARMKMSPEEISQLTILHNKRMLADGIHPFSKREDGSSIGAEISRKMVENGTHNFIGSPYAAQMYADGTHPFIGGEIQRATNARRIEDGTHNLLGDNNPSVIKAKNGTHQWQGSEANIARLANGTHSSQLKVCCLFCHGEFDKANYGRSHGDKCKQKS
jgi:hypothetical protein